MDELSMESELINNALNMYFCHGAKKGSKVPIDLDYIFKGFSEICQDDSILDSFVTMSDNEILNEMLNILKVRYFNLSKLMNNWFDSMGDRVVYITNQKKILNLELAIRFAQGVKNNNFPGIEGNEKMLREYYDSIFGKNANEGKPLSQMAHDLIMKYEESIYGTGKREKEQQ